METGCSNTRFDENQTNSLEVTFLERVLMNLDIVRLGLLETFHSLTAVIV